MPNTMKDDGLLLEALTRARKTVICVTNPGSRFRDIFNSAVEHHTKDSCDLDNDDGQCPFIAMPEIVKKDKVSMNMSL